MTVRALVVTGGHPFDEPAFAALLDSLDGVDVVRAEHPEAVRWWAPGALDAMDALVLYDMPGLRFVPAEDPTLVPPPAEVVAGWAAIAERGLGVVALHHSIASWPAWDGFAEVVGGRFHYVPASLRGTAWPDSGYAFDVTQTLTVVDPGHPVTAGLPASFPLTDETYCCPVFADDPGLVPLLRTDAPRDDAHHWSAALAVRGRLQDRTGWHHPVASDLAAWARAAGRSPVVYVQPGDGPGAFADPHYRRLVGNAVRWATSAEARAWAVGQAAARQ